jgi:hypothetical protein
MMAVSFTTAFNLMDSFNWNGRNKFLCEYKHIQNFMEKQNIMPC